MVRAILDGRKTMTRRVVDRDWWGVSERGKIQIECNDSGVLKCPYGQPGDRLWVRETFGEEYDYCLHPEMPSAGCEYFHYGWHYAADCTDEHSYSRAGDDMSGFFSGWKPSIFMPRRASRITLEITAVRVERLHDISESDAKSEGEDREGFKRLWDSENAKRGYCWEVNPWVWVIEFKTV
jgi:hypothetical protein